jgi:hypothetical protein
MSGLTISQEDCRNLVEKPSDPRALSGSMDLSTFQTSASENRSPSMERSREDKSRQSRSMEFDRAEGMRYKRLKPTYLKNTMTLSLGGGATYRLLHLLISYHFQTPIICLAHSQISSGKVFRLSLLYQLAVLRLHSALKGLILTLQFVAGMLSWSSDSHYFFTRNDNMPTALWIWDICRLELATVLVQKDLIRTAAWDPTCSRLALCTESPHLYMWTPSGAFCINNPLPNFRIVDLKWSSDGSRLLMKDRESFGCAEIACVEIPSALHEEESDQTDGSTEDE